jgi:hypothetical protein
MQIILNFVGAGLFVVILMCGIPTMMVLGDFLQSKLSEHLTKRAADKANASDVCIACQREHNKNHIGLR